MQTDEFTSGTPALSASPTPPSPTPTSTPSPSKHHAHFSSTLVSSSPAQQAFPIDPSSSTSSISPYDPSARPPVKISASPTLVNVDIEHVTVENDPREWSSSKKSLVLAMVSIGSIPPTLGAAIYNPAFDELRSELHATSAELALSLSLFILCQGCFPVFWSAVAEVKGRKPVYLVSYTLFIIGTLVASRANSMALLIVMRMLQATGSSAVLSIGAGTLADIFEPKVRGRKMGLYYSVPMIGTSIGPIIGGVLTQAFGWRSTFYFIAAFGGACLISFCFFPDTWRRERSLAYQAALKKSIATTLASTEKKRLRKISKGLRSGDATPAGTRPGSPDHPLEFNEEKVDVVVEEQKGGRRKWWVFGKKHQQAQGEVKLGIRDINPLPPALAILKSPLNTVAVISSGILFAAQYTISFTAAVTFADSPYNYDALKVGLVLVAFGGGNIIGSVLGGRYSDFVLAKLKRKNGGVSEPEMRLKSVFLAMPFMVLSFLGYAWTAQEKVNIAGPVVFLAIAGISLMVIYASVLAYLVDSNPGRSSSAVACNSFCRGTFACIFSEIALPIRDAIGDGGLYSIFSGLLLLTCISFTVLAIKGKSWRDPDHSFRRRRPRDTEALDKEIVPNDLKDAQPTVP